MLISLSSGFAKSLTALPRHVIQMAKVHLIRTPGLRFKAITLKLNPPCLLNLHVHFFFFNCRSVGESNPHLLTGTPGSEDHKGTIQPQNKR